MTFKLSHALMGLALSLGSLPISAAAPLNPLGNSQDLTAVKEWHKVANGVYRVTIGDHSKTMRYSDLAGATPKLKTLNQLPDVPLSKALKGTSYRIMADGKVMVRIPTEKGEKM